MSTFATARSAQSAALPSSQTILRVALCICGLVSACGGGNHSTEAELDAALADEDAALEKIDAKILTGSIRPVYANGTQQKESAQSVQGASLESPMAAGPNAHLRGSFGAAFDWPGVPIHQVLLPDGRVMTYGTDPTGKVDAKLHYAVWQPTAGIGDDAFDILPNATRSYIFCATQLLVPDTGDVIVVGGTRPDAWRRIGFGEAAVTYFSYRTNTLRRDPRVMPRGRYYATVVTTGRGEQVVLGGRENAAYPARPPAPASTATFVGTPEVYHAGQGWRVLTGATSETAYGSLQGSWNYPRAWLAPNGNIFGITLRGGMYSLDPTGAGRVTTYAAKTAPATTNMTSVMFAPGKILSLRERTQAVVVDIRGATPVVSPTASLSRTRRYSNATLLADGKVFLNGGSTGEDRVSAAIYDSEIWDPKTGRWTPGAVAAVPRLYHSASLLLPDATVLTGGGVTDDEWWLSAEIYTPPYLFKTDGSGQLAPRPVITSAPTTEIGWNRTLDIGVGAGDRIGRVTLVRTGAVTHAFNNDQRMNELTFTQTGATLRVNTPENPNLAPPGYYMLFVLNTAGVPSKARIVRLNGA